MMSFRELAFCLWLELEYQRMIRVSAYMHGKTRRMWADGIHHDIARKYALDW
jgi:hypothetical protein